MTVSPQWALVGTHQGSQRAQARNEGRQSSEVNLVSGCGWITGHTPLCTVWTQALLLDIIPPPPTPHLCVLLALSLEALLAEACCCQCECRGLLGAGISSPYLDLQCFLIETSLKGPCFPNSGASKCVCPGLYCHWSHQALAWDLGFRLALPAHCR